MDASLKALIDVNESLIRKLRSKRQEVESHQTGCLVAKTVGTTANTAGTTMAVIGVLGAPFTGGASLAFTVGGLAATAVGVGTNVVTDVVDNRCSQAFMNEVQSILGERDKVVRNLAEYLDKLGKTVDVGLAAGLSGEAAVGYAMRLAIAYSTANLRVFKPELAVELARAYQALSFITAAKTGAVGFTGFAKVGSEAMKSLPKVVSNMEPAMISAGLKPSAGLVSLSGKVVGGVAKGLAVVGVAVQVWEIASLIQAWNTQHPTVEAIDCIIERLRQEATDCQKLLATMQELSSDTMLLQPDPVLPPIMVSVEMNRDFIALVLRHFFLEPEEFLKVVAESSLWDLKDEAEVYHQTKLLIIYSLLSDDDSVPVNREEFRKETKNKRKTVERIKELLAWVVKTVQNKRTKDKDKKKKRGDHVINNAVLKLHRDIVADFIRENPSLAGAYERLSLDSHLMQDTLSPLHSIAAESAVGSMVVYIDGERPPDHNAALYGETVRLLRRACVDHMNVMFRSGTHIPHAGTGFTATIRELVSQMNSYDGGSPIFVDEYARSLWLLTNAGSTEVYEMAKNAVKNMFLKLYERLQEWVYELKRS